MVVLDEPSQLSLREACAQKVKLREIIDDDGSEIQGFLDPSVESISVAVLDRTEGVSHTLV